LEAPHVRDYAARPARRRAAADPTAALLGGALTGCAAFAVMVLLGVALEVTAAAFVDDGASRTGLVAGAVVSLAASAVVAGVVGGGVLNGLAPRDGSYRPVLCALVSWAGGLVLTLILGLSLVSAWVLTGGGIVVSEAPARAAMPPGGALSERASPVAEAGSESAGAAAGLAWAIVLLPLLGLGGTIAAACAPRRGELRPLEEKIDEGSIDDGNIT
jgi:hypothetical protein